MSVPDTQGVAPGEPQAPGRDPPTTTTDASPQQAETMTDADLSQIWAWNLHLPETITELTHTTIARRAASHPTKPAVESWDGILTYGAAESLSTRLALRLVKAGVEVGTRIPLLFEKSRWTVVGVLAVMKAGATFILMDPSQPEARLRTIAEEAGARFILTSKDQEGVGARIAPGAEVFVVPGNDEGVEGTPVNGEAALTNGHTTSTPLQTPDDTPAQSHTATPSTGSPQLTPTSPLSTTSSTPSLPDVPPSTPMYIIFTSGSTGKPKGVVISHANYSSGAVPRARAVGYVHTSRVFDFASYAFDVSIDCMLCTLAAGGTLCVPSDADRMNDLSGAIRASGANMAHMTPSVARVLDEDVIPGLDVLGLGGEAVSGSDAASWGKDTSVVIAYGPSECTVGCTVNNDVSVSTNIGHGVGGLTWIVDPEDHDKLVPVGAVGELLMEGPVVGVGYLGDLEKTAEVFIEDPAWLLAGHGEAKGRRGRLYKTGDLVRYDPNGTGSIAFVGRKDQQVKLRGQRVELSEVEHHLRRHLDSFGQLVAEVIYPPGAEPTLVAFVSENKAAHHGLETELAQFSPELEQGLADAEAALEKEVPRYMIPSVFVPLTVIPSLVSGKTDRKKLKGMGQSMTREQLAGMKRRRRRVEKPETEMEVALQALWAKVLGSDVEIGLQDSFLALGGDSLRAMKLASVAREDGFTLTVATIFQSPTLRDMASKLEKTDAAASEPTAPFSLIGTWKAEDAKSVGAELCGVSTDDIEDVYPCTPLQEALMALSAKVQDAYVAQRVVKLDDADMAARLERAFDTATRDSAILRTRIVQVPEHGLIQVLLNKPIEWHRGANVDEYLAQDREDPMDLGKPLVRYGMITTPAGEHNFVLTMHHALYDGWSMPLVVDRINSAYKDKDSPLAPPPHFREFIRYLKDLDRSVGEAYWKEKLQGAVGAQFPMLPWPSYQPRAESLLEHYVPIQRHPASTATVATVLRGAWALVASEYTASRDVVFGETLTGRNAPVVGAELVEGPMITTVPIRMQIDMGESVTEYLDALQAQTGEQIPHEHIGLQHIRRLSPDALQACELRTGLVLHPTADDPVERPDADLPASRLVPTSDEEAAQEALRFNTYALMLVCSLDPKGFLIMASFDSKTVDMVTMDRVLKQLGRVVQQFCADPEGPVGGVELLDQSDRDGLLALSSEGAGHVQKEFPESKAAWVVDLADPSRLLPRGALGELVIQSTADLSVERIDPPSWLSPSQSEALNTYKTGRLATWSPDGTLTLKGLKSQLPSNHFVPKARTKAVSATSAKQKSLRSLWGRVLGMQEEDISLSDSFFQLGGDSISAMKLVSEARSAGWSLTVAKAFQNRSLYDMAKVLEEVEAKPIEQEAPVPFSLLEGLDTEALLPEVQSSLADPAWKVLDVLPVRPLQTAAIEGTIRTPRFSSRYEIMYFDAPVDTARLYKACQDLVSMTEILRTIFVRHNGAYLAAILEDLPTPVVEYEIDAGLEGFVRNLCDLDVQTSIPLGSAFVKWFHVREPSGKSSLVFRVSHAQYDEICLPILLKQLSALYERRALPESLPFSSYVNHAVKKSIPASVPYWKDLLAGSEMTHFRPEIPVTNTAHYAIDKTFDISARSTDTTVATLPPAIWALTLARRRGLRDVTFGNVVSGRNIDFHHAQSVLGPCWQYVPLRVSFSPSWTASDLLAHVQAQQIASSAHEALGLPEISKHCPGWEDVDWFDTVIHQDVEHVTELPFVETRCRMETYYAQEEPLKEWKIQAFVSGEKLTVEIVTVESWKEVAGELLEEIGGVLKEVLYTPEKLLFED